MEEENESDHFEPIRMRLMADEMFQLTFQIENLDQILENPRVYNTSQNFTQLSRLEKIQSSRTEIQSAYTFFQTCIRNKTESK